MSQIDYPFHFDGRGRTAQTDTSGYIRDLIEQVLLTAPGERVMRPTFGSGVMQLVFAAASPEIAATTQFLIQGALQQWLSDVITGNVPGNAGSRQPMGGPQGTVARGRTGSARRAELRAGDRRLATGCLP